MVWFILYVVTVYTSYKMGEYIETNIRDNNLDIDDAMCIGIWSLGGPFSILFMLAIGVKEYIEENGDGIVKLSKSNRKDRSDQT